MVQIESTLTCPRCRHQSTEQMPTDARRFFYACKGCGKTLKPLPGECYVFCSYGTVPCPPVQARQRCSWAAGRLSTSGSEPLFDHAA